MDLGDRVETIVKNFIEPVFETSAVSPACPCLSWISANGRYAYDTAMGQRLSS